MVKKLVVTGSFNCLASEFHEPAPGIGAAHIHLGVAGTNGDIVFTLKACLCKDKICGKFDECHNTFCLTDDQLCDLQARQYYINIHSKDMPGGELHGQLLPSECQYLVYVLPIPSSFAKARIMFDLIDCVLTASGTFESPNPLAFINGDSSTFGFSIKESNTLKYALMASKKADVVGNELVTGCFPASNNTFVLKVTDKTSLNNKLWSVVKDNFSVEAQGQICKLEKVTKHTH